MKAENRTVACLDVGKPENVGWAVLGDKKVLTGSNLHRFADALTGALEEKRKLAIGFECPLYVPRRSDPTQLTNIRIGEGQLNWIGGPGGSVLSVGLVQVGWVLQSLVNAIPGRRGTTRWKEFNDSSDSVFLWEAFITSREGSQANLSVANTSGLSGHVLDALAGAVVARDRFIASDTPDSDLANEAATSLIGMHLIATGMSNDLSLLRETCLVVKARKPS